MHEEESKMIELRLFLTKYIKNLRQKNNLTQAQLAKQVKTSQSRLAKLEADRIFQVPSSLEPIQYPQN